MPLISYASAVLCSIDLRLWLIFAAGSIVLWHLLKRQEIALRSAIIYTAFILILTFFSREGSHEQAVALMPLWSWGQVLFHGNYELFVQICLNLLLFVPLGGLLGCCRWVQQQQRPLLLISLAGLVLSISIEWTQLLFHLGLFEWDDMLHNTIGCALGGLAASLLKQPLPEP